MIVADRSSKRLISLTFPSCSQFARSNVTRKVSVAANFVFVSMSLLYQHDSSQGSLCGELNNFDDKNSQLFCTGDLERSYAECHLGLLVCSSVVLVQISIEF